jgi:hypothetical protein
MTSLRDVLISMAVISRTQNGPAISPARSREMLDGFGIRYAVFA